MNILLFGAEAGDIEKYAARFRALKVVESDPEVVVCYGGDGTLLAAELKWPGIPKVPIRNSRRGQRCIPHPPDRVLERLAKNDLVRCEYAKLECALCRPSDASSVCCLTAMNEVNVHMGHINVAVRFNLWIDDEPYDAGKEIVGDGFVVCTPFGSTAYFNQITRGLFYRGLGVAFKYTAEHTNHLVLPEDAVIRARMTRGPAVLAYDNAPEYLQVSAGDELIIRRHDAPAVLLTWQAMSHPSDEF
ncbi:MAG TPA: hypothetical protein HPP77_09565 [Candidatus Hydrogenedentes bacterium]|nr:hypothetical protein [Candidatus Hydrogenedentota bacterium]HIJ72881.1 hypothetical protein [Candidatus Hydrogenedentota bacterium]